MQIDHQKSREIFVFHKGSSENQNSIQERLFSPRRSFSILFPPSKITPLSNAGSTTKGSNRRHVIIFYFPSLSLPPWVAARNRKTTRWIKETGERIVDEIVVEERNSTFVVRMHSPWNFYSCRESPETPFELLHPLCVCIPLNK